MRVPSVLTASAAACVLLATAPLTGSASAAGNVLFVVAAPSTLTAGETAIRSRLAGAGYQVTVADDDTVTGTQAATASFVLVGQSISSNGPAVKSLASLAVPVWVAKPYLFDDFGLTGTVAGTDYADKPGSPLSIAAPGHPMAAGRTGTVTLQSGGRVSVGRPAPSATVVARAGTDAAVFTIEPGDTLADGAPAPACRVTFPIYANGPATFTADGWALFDATASWTAANCTAGPPVDAPPAVQLTSPAAGATVSAMVTLSAVASDDVGVAGVAFGVDGGQVAADTSSTYSTLWDSGAVPPGQHTVTATDTAGQTSAATVTVTVEAVPPPTGVVLLVVATPATTTPGENAVRSRLTGAGFTVTVTDDNTVTAAQANGAAFLLVAQSVNANLTNVRGLGSLTVPVWVAKPYLFDDFGLTGPAPGTDYADKPGSTLTVVAAGHPLAAGRTGTVAIQSGGRLSVGRPAAAVTVVARAGADASVFTLSPGQPLADGSPAPACRLSFPVYGNGPATFTADGWAMFDAAAMWAAGNCAAGPPPEPGEVRHVVLVSVDGLNPQAITQLGPAGAPTFYRLMSEGVSTLNARTVVEATQTLPNHTSMVTGRPVTAAGGTR